MINIIKNFDDLATTNLRKNALTIALSAYKAIDTREVIKKNLKIENNILSVGNKSFILKDYERLFVLGFGKVSCKAVQTIEDILEGHITGGVVIDKNVGVCKVVKVYQGTHPKPNVKNVEFSEQITSIAKDAGERDLVIVVVSGGGSSLLCWPLSECDQGNSLYNKFLNSGGSIDELNTVRKHLSLVKGGGLAKILYPANVISLVFSDVPGNVFEDVASGPTYFDNSTVEDAKNILNKYNIMDTFTLNETPKERMYFEKIYNFPIVSNLDALKAMSKCAKDLGYEPKLAPDNIYSDTEHALSMMQSLSGKKVAVIGGGELSVKVKEGGKGIGGRNEFAGAVAIEKINEGELFMSFASDGIDNLSEAGGVLIDDQVKTIIKEKNINVESYKKNNDEDSMFKLIGNQIITGPTSSNVSDLFILIKD